MMRQLKTIAALLLVGVVATSIPTNTVHAAVVQQDLNFWLAKIDYLVKNRYYALALEELDNAPQDIQSDARFVRYIEYVNRIINGVPKEERLKRAAAAAPKAKLLRQRFRIAMRRHDANSGSDTSFHPEGLLINQNLLADVEGKDGIDARFEMDLDGFLNGHEDVRYRTLLADFYTNGPYDSQERASHFAVGDSATFTSPFFLRGSRLRGINWYMPGPRNEFQLVGGVYPLYRELADQYIYPRTVVGIRDRVRFLEDRIRFGANFVYTQDNEKIRHLDTANRPRENAVLSFDQALKPIPDVWFVKMAQAYSWTDDNLLSETFQTDEDLRDTAFIIDSRMIQPWGVWTSYYERIGPDFLLMTDVPSGSVTNAKGITQDRLYYQNKIDFKPFWNLDLDVEAAYYKNNLDNSDIIAETRQQWYTIDAGIDVPKGWPVPRLRASIIDTITSPGSEERPDQTRDINIRGDLSYAFHGVRMSAFAAYVGEEPTKEEESFDEEDRWTMGVRFGIPLLKRLYVSTRYQYDTFDELYNLVRHRGSRHKVDVSTSLRLWHTAQLGLSYSFQNGKLVHPDASTLIDAHNHGMTANFLWPYRFFNKDKRETFTLTPSFTYHYTDFSKDLESRPLIATALDLAYSIHEDIELTLRGEYRYNEDIEQEGVIQNEETVFKLEFSSEWQ